MTWTGGGFRSAQGSWSADFGRRGLADDAGALTYLAQPLLDLYRHWWSLPPKSVRRHVDDARRQLLAALGDGSWTPQQTGELVQALQQFWQAVEQLPAPDAVAPAVEDAKRRIAQVQSGSVAPTVEQVDRLLQALAAADPFEYLLRQLHFAPDRLRATWNDVARALSDVTPRLAPAHAAQLAPYLADDADMRRVAQIREAVARSTETPAALAAPRIVTLAGFIDQRFSAGKVVVAAGQQSTAAEWRTVRTRLQAPEGSFPRTEEYIGSELLRQEAHEQLLRELAQLDVVRRAAGQALLDGMTAAPPTVYYDTGWTRRSADLVAKGPLPPPPTGGAVALASGAAAGDSAAGVSAAFALSSGLESMGAEAAASSPVETQFYTDVRFPARVLANTQQPLTVRLTLGPPAESRVADATVTVPFEEPAKAEYVEIVLVAPGFLEYADSWSRTIAVRSDRDSQPALFLLTASSEVGVKRLTLDFYHRERYLGSAAFTSEIAKTGSSGEPVAQTVEARLEIAHFLSQPPPPADLELRITKGSADNVLHFMLHSTKAGVGYHWQPMGTVELNAADPQKFLDHKFQRLSQLAAQITPQVTEESTRVALADVESLGEELFEQLFPELLRTAYWQHIKPARERGLIKSLLITSDEPWIPWELVKPYQQDPFTGAEQGDDFLAATFEVCRWLVGRGPADRVNIAAANVVVPQLDLAYVQKERSYFDDLASRGTTAVSVLQRREQVLATAQAGGVQLLHFAAHGRFDPDNPDLSPLSLEDGTLSPDDLTGSRARGLRQARPVVFLNACHTGRVAFALTGLGGWASRMVNDLWVTAFIGTLWEVNDLLAAEFAVHFYDQLQSDATLGAAFQRARLHIRTMQPANPTWLAYTLYGDPNSRVTWGDPA